MGEMERWGDGVMGRWSDGEMERWRDGEMEWWSGGVVEMVETGEMGEMGGVGGGFRAESPVDFLAQAEGLGDGASRNVIGLKARPIHAFCISRYASGLQSMRIYRAVGPTGCRLPSMSQACSLG